MRLAVYARTSKHRGDAVSIGDQERQARGWAAREGHEVVGQFRDEGVSGANGVDEREGLPAALVAIRDGQADGLLVLRLDRLARSLTTQEAILAKAWGLGGGVFTAEGGEVLRDDPDDPMRTFVRQVMGAVSELERRMIAKRLRDGRREAARRGRYVGGGRIHRRYGWRLEGGRYEQVPEEQAAIARMRAARGGGATLQAIADDLNRRGAPTSGGGRWHASTVRKVLLREERREER